MSASIPSAGEGRGPQVLRLFELIRDTPFGIRLVTRSTSTNRRIDGAHVVEMLDPGRWLATNYLALTTGIALKGSTRRQEEFVASVDRAGCAALAFGTGVHFKRIPPAMIEAGERLGLPIVSVPFEVPFREVTRFVSRSTLAVGFQDFSRALRVQDYLLASLEQSDAEASLAKRLGELIVGSAAIFHCDGRTVAYAGRPPIAAMWTAIREKAHVARLPQKRIVWVEARVGGAPCYYLSACVRDDDRSEAYAVEVLKFGARVAQAVSAARHLATAQERAIRSGLLVEVLASSAVTSDAAAQLRIFRLDKDAPTNLLVARVRSPRADDDTREGAARAGDVLTAVQACEAALTSCHVPHLACITAGRSAVAIWQDPSERTMVMQALHETSAELSLSIGLGRATTDMAHLQQALTEARVALQRAEDMAGPAVVTYDDLSLRDLLLTHSPPELGAVAQAMLAPLRDRGDMLQTLVQYLEHNCDVIACAKHLFLHPNTLRYRLSRIETLLGCSLRSVPVIAELHWALHLEGLSGDGARLQPALGQSALAPVSVLAEHVPAPRVKARAARSRRRA